MAIETGLYLLMPLAILAVRRAWRERGDLRLLLPLACIVPHMAYVFRIGGDYFEYRPLDFYWPLLAVPAASGIVDLGVSASALLRRPRSGRLTPGPGACAVVLFVPTLFYAGALQGRLLFQGARAESYQERFHPEVDQGNAGWLLAAPGMRALASISNDLRWRMTRQLVGLRFAEHREAARLKLEDWADYERMERDVFPEDALTATGALGIQSYFLPDLRVVDGHGLVDAVVARNPVARVSLRPLGPVPTHVDGVAQVWSTLWSGPSPKGGWPSLATCPKHRYQYHGRLVSNGGLSDGESPLVRRGEEAGGFRCSLCGRWLSLRPRFEASGRKEAAAG